LKGNLQSQIVKQGAILILVGQRRRRRRRRRRMVVVEWKENLGAVAFRGSVT